MHGMNDIVLIGKEAVARGTLALTFPLHQPFVGDGLTPTRTQHLAEVRPSSSHPDPVAQVPLGLTTGLSLTPEINIATIRDLIDMVTKRTGTDLPSLSIKHGQAGVSDKLFLGCVASQLSLESSRSGSPDGASLLTGSINLECMQALAGSGVVAGTQGSGRHFNIGKSTFTINAVGALEVLSYSRSINNTLDLGPLNTAGDTRLWITDGETEQEVTLTARFTDEAWEALIENATEHAVIIVHATGTADETVTETMGKVQLSTHEITKENGTVIQRITIKPFHTGAAAATVWTYGSAIGVSALLL